MERFRLSTLMLLIIIAALGVTVVMQERRTADMQNILRGAVRADRLTRLGRLNEARPLWSQFRRRVEPWAGEE